VGWGLRCTRSEAEGKTMKKKKKKKKNAKGSVYTNDGNKLR
jgi:hypothetical protein